MDRNFLEERQSTDTVFRDYLDPIIVFSVGYRNAKEVSYAETVIQSFSM